MPEPPYDPRDDVRPGKTPWLALILVSALIIVCGEILIHRVL